MNRELIDYIAKVHSVSRDHLAQVSCNHVAPERQHEGMAR